jgi:Protein of unknown function (DUF3102)
MAENRSSAVAGTKRAPGEYRERGLELLADEIRRHHKAVERHARAMLDEAIAAGEKLIEAKARLPHGEFEPFKAYCGVSRSSASVYMKLAREKSSAGVLEAASIREALETLGGTRKKPEQQEIDFGRAAKSRASWRDGRRWQRRAHREALRTGRWDALPYAPNSSGGEEALADTIKEFAR